MSMWIKESKGTFASCGGCGGGTAAIAAICGGAVSKLGVVCDSEEMVWDCGEVSLLTWQKVELYNQPLVTGLFFFISVFFFFLSSFSFYKQHYIY